MYQQNCRTSGKFRYLGTNIEENGKLDRQVEDRPGKAGRIYDAMRSTSLGKREVPKAVKTELERNMISLTILCGSEV